MYQYLEALNKIHSEGAWKEDRTGTGTRSIFGMQMRFDLREGFPVVTTKRIHLKSVIHELLWIISGDTDIERLTKAGVKIWDNWANWQDGIGHVGRSYGAQWRTWANPQNTFRANPLDQLAGVIEEIKRNPDSRRLLVTAWNPAELDYTILPPCHVMFQFYVVNGELSCSVYQRKQHCALNS